MTTRSAYYLGKIGTIPDKNNPGQFIITNSPHDNPAPVRRSAARQGHGFLFDLNSGFLPPARHAMQIIPVKQNASVNIVVLLRDSQTNKGRAGLNTAPNAITTQISKNGAALGTITPTITDLGSGLYKIAFTSGHTDTLGIAQLRFTGQYMQDNAEYQLNVQAFDPLAGIVTVGSYSSGQNPGGSLKPNCVIDNYTYNSVNKPLTWRERVFSTSAAADTAYAAVNTTTGQGNADGADGEIEREKYTAEYDAVGTKLLALKRHKEL